MIEAIMIIFTIAICFVLAKFLIPSIYNIFLFQPSYFEYPLERAIDSFKTPFGINCLFVDNGDDTPIILFSHGNAGNIEMRQPMFDLFHNTKFSLFMYDYKGFGKSDKIQTTVSSILTDADQIYNFIKSKYPKRKIILWGESMGSYPTWYLADKYQVDGVIVTSGFANLKDTINSICFPFFAEFLSIFVTIPNNLRYIKKVTCPVLILHGSSDSLIDKSDAAKVFSLYNGNKKELVFKNQDHCLDMNSVSNDILGWLSKTIE